MKPRVRGFIYGVAGNAGMGVWAQKPLFTNQIQWIFSISIIFGHRQSFLKNCSPWPVPFWAHQRFLQEKIQLSLESRENILSKHAACAQSRFLVIEPLYLYFKLLLLCPNSGNPWGTFPKNLFLCPNAQAERPSYLYKFKERSRGKVDRSRDRSREVATGRKIATSPWKYRNNSVQYISGFETPTTAGITDNEQISNTRRKR